MIKTPHEFMQLDVGTEKCGKSQKSLKNATKKHISSKSNMQWNWDSSDSIWPGCIVGLLCWTGKPKGDP